MHCGITVTKSHSIHGVKVLKMGKQSISKTQKLSRRFTLPRNFGGKPGNILKSQNHQTTSVHTSTQTSVVNRKVHLYTRTIKLNVVQKIYSEGRKQSCRYSRRVNCPKICQFFDPVANQYSLEEFSHFKPLACFSVCRRYFM